MCITTGIYRCSILDYDLKFCENFWLSRISADKRFFIFIFRKDFVGFCEVFNMHPTTLIPGPGLLRGGLHLQIYNIFSKFKNFLTKNRKMASYASPYA